MSASFPTVLPPNTITTSSGMTTNTTSSGGDSTDYPKYVGYICALVAVLMYGSNFVPIKKYYTGDGMFFQYILCSGIFLVGMVVQIIFQSTFYPLVMLGGFIWATGNLCVVPIFKTIGMGMGMSIWGTVSLITGWAFGRFGLFVKHEANITNSAMNYAGVGLAVVSIIFYVMVKNEVSASTDFDIIVEDEDTDPLIPAGGTDSSINDSLSSDHVLTFNKETNSSKTLKISAENSGQGDDRMFIERLAPSWKKLIGYTLSVFSGFMYGINFTPALHWESNSGDTNGLHFVFAHFCGIYVSSSLYFYIYCVYQRNKPKVYPEVILPGIVSGIMWGIATTSWFVANAILNEAITFPMISTAPSAIASLFWGVLVFHEIKGLRNILILLVAFCIMAAGAILAGLSQ